MATNRVDVITDWVKREFSAKYVSRVVNDLVDVASGNRPGNPFELQSLARLFPGTCPKCGVHSHDNAYTDHSRQEFSCEACEVCWNVKPTFAIVHDRETEFPASY